MSLNMIEHCEAITAAAPRVAGSGTAPMYVICSPSRRVGKTLVARLLTEHYIADVRPVLAFDLADEAPQLTNFLTDHASVAHISDLRGQMRLFDGLIESNTVPKIIDVSHREFTNFFAIAEKIGLFEEARRRSNEPKIQIRRRRRPMPCCAGDLSVRRSCRYAILRWLKACLMVLRFLTPAPLRFRWKFRFSDRLRERSSIGSGFHLLSSTTRARSVRIFRCGRTMSCTRGGDACGYSFAKSSCA
jgi:hypothetical protein